MTISYPDSFSKSLFRWKGSLWKAVYLNIAGFWVAYYVVFFYQSVILSDSVNRNTSDYSRFCSDGPPNVKREHFMKLVRHFESATHYIPITFLLGFFVAGVLTRWWEQFNWISWPDKLMMIVDTCLGEEEHIAVRRTIARWANLQAAIAWRLHCVRTKARFPTLHHLVDARLMSPEEEAKFESIEAPYGKWFVPTVWITNLLRRLHKDKIIDSVQLELIIQYLMSYRDGFAMLYVYDWVHIPLVYTHVVSLATYGYFTMCIVARQPNIALFCEMVRHNDCDWIFYLSAWVSNFIPIFTTFQMAFFMGWLKVGQYLMSPFGDDDDDFELNWILDRNQHTAYLLCDELCQQEMPTDFDPFEKLKVAIPHTKASIKIHDIPPRDSLGKFVIKEKDMEFIGPDDYALLIEKQHNEQKWVSMARLASGRTSLHRWAQTARGRAGTQERELDSSPTKPEEKNDERNDLLNG